MCRRLIEILVGLLLGIATTSLPAQEFLTQPLEESREQAEEGEGEMEEAEEEEEDEEDEIETDRDSFTPATTTAGPGRLIFETSHSFIDNRNVPETNSFPEILARYGVGDRLEFRFGWNYEVGGAGNPISGNIPDDLEDEKKLERESRLLYGIKMICTEQSNSLPSSAVILQGFTPTSGESNDSDLSVSYVFGWQLPNDWTLDSGVRYSTGHLEEDNFNIWSPSTVLKIPVGERWKIHAEYFGVFSDTREAETTQHFFSPGAHFLINPNLEMGVRLGCGLNDQSPGFFINTGLGYRF